MLRQQQHASTFFSLGRWYTPAQLLRETWAKHERDAGGGGGGDGATDDASSTILARFAMLSRDLSDSAYREHFQVKDVSDGTAAAEPSGDCWLCPGGDAEFRVALHERLFPDISPVAQLERVLERGELIDRSILFVGDSLTLQLYEAARCTLPSKFHDARVRRRGGAGRKPSPG